jgi:hypothetical protein
MAQIHISKDPPKQTPLISVYTFSFIYYEGQNPFHFRVAEFPLYISNWENNRALSLFYARVEQKPLSAFRTAQGRPGRRPPYQKII